MIIQDIESDQCARHKVKRVEINMPETSWWSEVDGVEVPDSRRETEERARVCPECEGGRQLIAAVGLFVKSGAKPGEE